MTQMATQERVTSVRPLMNNERIIGILIYTVLHGELTNEVMELARSVPMEYYQSIDSEDNGHNWGMVGYFVHSKGTKSELPMNDQSLAYLQDMLRSEIAGMAAWIAAGRPDIDEVDWYGGEDIDDE
jgi:hypothetical protein